MHFQPEIPRLWRPQLSDDCSPVKFDVFGSGRDYSVPTDLTKIQTDSYKAFLQNNIDPEKRKGSEGIESVLQEIFPIESYDKKLTLNYVRYDLGKPRYTPEECRQLRLTYGQTVPGLVAIGKRTARRGRSVPRRHSHHARAAAKFIINGAERVVVSQLHRSPGIDFVMESDYDFGSKVGQLSSHS